MTIDKIEGYLAQKNTVMDPKVGEIIEELRQIAISKGCEIEANYYWCLTQIYRIQKGFIHAFSALHNHKYEEAWCEFDRVDINLGNLENNFDTAQENDKYHMIFIGEMIKEYQKLFPYRYFLSRECVIKSEECSICGKPISIRHPCGHKVGKLYMGELCLRKVVDMDFKALSVVSDPFDKYSYIKLEDKEYNYGMLEALMAEIKCPYDEFRVETIKVLKPEYKGIGRNEICPCGSGKKYKKCHLGTANELMDHYRVQILKPKVLHRNKNDGTFETWKRESN